MNFLELAKKRRSVRHYTQQAVEKEKLDYILECARVAPSAVNRQPWQFIVVQDARWLERLATCYHGKWFAEAPACIVVCARVQEAWVRSCDGKNHADIDAAIATEHICLAAAEQGLGTCWVCNFDVVVCKDVLGLADGMEPVALIPLGYPGPDALREFTRKDIGEVASFL